MYSRTLADVRAPNAQLFREFDAEAIRALKRSSSQDISVGGAELATQVLEANLIDELHFVVHPLMVGGGKPALRPSVRRKFGLIEPVVRHGRGLSAVSRGWGIRSTSTTSPRRGAAEIVCAKTESVD